MNGCCFGQIVEPSQPAIAIHFPLAAPARYDLVRAGLQTATGFTFSENQKGQGAVVGKVQEANRFLGCSHFANTSSQNNNNEDSISNPNPPHQLNWLSKTDSISGRIAKALGADI